MFLLFRLTNIRFLYEIVEQKLANQISMTQNYHSFIAFLFLVSLLLSSFPLSLNLLSSVFFLLQTVSIELSYTPSLPHSAIREEAIRLATEAARNRAREEAAALAAQQREKDSTSTPEVEREMGGIRLRGRFFRPLFMYYSGTSDNELPHNEKQIYSQENLQIMKKNQLSQFFHYSDVQCTTFTI